MLSSFASRFHEMALRLCLAVACLAGFATAATVTRFEYPISTSSTSIYVTVHTKLNTIILDGITFNAATTLGYWIHNCRCSVVQYRDRHRHCANWYSANNRADFHICHDHTWNHENRPDWAEADPHLDRSSNVHHLLCFVSRRVEIWLFWG